MIIWDTGEYEVLPYKVDPETETETERDESTSDSSAPSSSQGLTESDKLREAFRNVCMHAPILTLEAYI